VISSPPPPEPKRSPLPSPTRRRLRILFAGHSLAVPRGGGELSARTLLQRLARYHQVEAVLAGRESRTYAIDGPVACRDHGFSLAHPPAGVPFHLATMLLETRFRSILRHELRHRPPDILLLQQPACPDPSDVPPSTRVIVFMRSLLCYGAGNANPSAWRRSVSRPFRSVRFWRARALLRRADLIVSNSHFLQGALKEHAGLNSHVIAPFIDTNALRRSPPADEPHHVTFVGLDAWKGASIALRIAGALPERTFLFLQGPRSAPGLLARARRLANVTCEGWTEDMGHVFARTRLLLVPSVWEEPFGRLAVEAGACGVPTLASARGGLPESVGDGGVLVDPVDDLPQWIASIRRLDDPEVYATMSAAARAHAAAYDVDVTVRRFEELARHELDVELGAPA